jgi:hypothetical protein
MKEYLKIVIQEPDKDAKNPINLYWLAWCEVGNKRVGIYEAEKPSIEDIKKLASKLGKTL